MVEKLEQQNFEGSSNDPTAAQSAPVDNRLSELLSLYPGNKANKEQMGTAEDSLLNAV